MSHCFIDVKKRQKHSIYSVGGAVAGVTENYLGFCLSTVHSRRDVVALTFIY